MIDVALSQTINQHCVGRGLVANYTRWSTKNAAVYFQQ